MGIVAKFADHDSEEKIMVIQEANGKFYNHYSWNPEWKSGSCIAGGFNTQEDAERMVMIHRPTARKIRLFEPGTVYIGKINGAMGKVIRVEKGKRGGEVAVIEDEKGNIHTYGMQALERCLVDVIA